MKIITYEQPIVLSDSVGADKCFGAPDICAHCGAHLQFNSKPFTPDFIGREGAKCNSCGWWYIVVDNDGCNDGFVATICGAISAYDDSSSDLPMEWLYKEISNNYKSIHNIDSRRFELVVQDILRGIHDCEVMHIGKTGDGGIDLLIFDSDSPIAVQIKRRENSNKVELVSCVREFLGAALLSSKQRLLYVSTNNFSRGAHSAAETAVNLSIVQKFELLSFDKLLAHVKRKSTFDPWSRYLSRDPNSHWYRNRGLLTWPNNSTYEQYIRGIQI